jgi:wyosine [tRNA(Phe)-imidazoG37] synthetase (radical SAM superfamily)
VSLGINLNPDTICNFDCVYCQVERSTPPRIRAVDETRLLQEMEEMLDLVCSGQLFEQGHFASTPIPLRRLNDIAFSGDGEPTTYPRFREVVQAVIQIKRGRGLDGVKLVLITNATMFHRPPVREALRLLDDSNGEIWAKLEAGTDAYYRAVNRSTIPWQRILDNLTEAARARPLVIQALFLRLHGAPPPPDELEAFCDRLTDMLHAGGQIKLVQVYTVARKPAESYATPLTDAEVDAIVSLVRQRTGLCAEPFY